MIDSDLEGIEDDEPQIEDTFDPGQLKTDQTHKRESEVEMASLVTNMDNNYRAKEDDFEKLKLLGKGGYGSVYLVRKNEAPNAGNLYAMKVLKKAKIVCSEKDTAHIKSERNILGQIRHPFIVRLHYAFQTRGKLYLVMEFIQGGELFMMLERERILEEGLSKMYLAQITLALGYLHQLGIIFRDLKPENILLGADGYIKLIDFGLCKERVGNGNRTYTYCGTIEYMAPEVITKQGHDQSADWWSLGALMFDMLTGCPPFSADTKRETQDLILRGQIRQPSGVTPEAKNLLKSLLQRNHTTRLGGGDFDALEIQRHCWFHDMDWRKLERKELPVLYQPPISGPEDVSLFDKRFAELSVSYESPTHTPINGNIFQDFSYQEPVALEHVDLLHTVQQKQSEILKFHETSKKRNLHTTQAAPDDTKNKVTSNGASTNGRKITSSKNININ